MKTKTITLLFLALVITASAFATEAPRMNVVTINDSKVLVAAQTSAEFPLEVTLCNTAGEVVYYKKAKGSSQFKSLLDLHQLEDGNYTICLKTGKESAQRELEVHKGTVAVKRLVSEVEPVFSCKNDIVHVTYLNKNKQNMSILVYKHNTLLLESKLGCDFNIQRCFNVSKYAEGDLEFVLHGADKNYSYKITQ